MLLISKVPEHVLNLVVLLRGRSDLSKIHGVGIELLELLEAVDVVEDLEASSRNKDLVAGGAYFVLLLLGRRAAIQLF